jgi:nucleoside phosphorylase
VLPLNEDSAPSEDGSLWFVRETGRMTNQSRLPMVVGTTAYADSLARVQDVFREYLWNVVLVTTLDDRWPRLIQHALRYAKSSSVVSDVAKASPSASAQKCDVAIVTALRTPEFSELIDALGGGDQLWIPDTSEAWLNCNLSRDDGTDIGVVAACADEMGMTAMASLVTRVCMRCHPQALLLVGISAGNPDRVHLSDLILVDSTWDCRAGKLTENGFSADVRSRECSYKLANLFSALVGEDFRIGFWSKWKGERPPNVPQLHRGDVACSPAVVADKGIFSELESQKRKIVGLEMEAYGCYTAARRMGDLGPHVLCIKSVCDFGDGAKNDKYQGYCAALSAASVVHVLKDNRFVL